MTLRGPSFVKDVSAMSRTISLTKTTFLTYILPPVGCLYLMGVLVQLHGTHTYRMALLPVAVYLAWRATFVDMSGGDLVKAQINVALITQMCIVATRSVVWAFARVRYQRQGPAADQNRSDLDGPYAACWNTWDLLLNTRGIGWNWSRGLTIPKSTFETNSRVVFVAWMAVAVLLNAIGLDACVQTIHSLYPDTFGSLKSGPLFDNTLPPILGLLRALLASFLTAASAYFGLQHTYQLLAIVCVTVFRQHPSQWPPLFDAPLTSTSLSELWGRRWHQLMRDSVLNLGFQPFNRLFGRFGGLFGAFLISGVFHNFDLGRRGHSGVCFCFWAMNALGVVLERLWKKTTGRPVNGILGWMWTAGWLFFWGTPMVDVYGKVGRLGALGVAGGFRPWLALVALVQRVFRVVGSWLM